MISQISSDGADEITQDVVAWRDFEEGSSFSLCREVDEIIFYHGSMVRVNAPSVTYVEGGRRASLKELMGEQVEELPNRPADERIDAVVCT